MPTDRIAYPRIKLHRPTAVQHLLPRPRLLQQLDQVLQRPAAVIAAPAGFGKTVLLSQWMERCPLPNAWLQLDESDHELPAFFTGLVAALRQIFPDSLQETANLLPAQRRVPPEVWKSALINDLELLEETPFVLALDDYHLVGNPSADLLLADVLGYEPLPLHLVLSARHGSPLSFSKLKLQGRVVEIRTADLRFTDAEAAAYLAQTVATPFQASTITHLQERTEGWAAGLALVALSLHDDLDLEDLITRLDESDSQVNDYLMDQVFQHQPAEIQDFLLKTAAFKPFCAAMLADVFDSGQSEAEIQALLERVESTQLFLIPLDTQRIYFRYHHLFRQMLLARRRYHLRPEHIEQFHRRAAGWLIRQDQPDEALSHLVAVRDWPEAARLVESRLVSLLNAEDFQGIKHRLAYFPEEFIPTRPGLLLMQAWIAHFGLRLPLLLSLTNRIQALVEAAMTPDRDAGDGSAPAGFEIIPPRDVLGQVRVMQGLLFFLANQVSQASAAARQAAEWLPQSHLFARGNAMLYLGLSQLMEGQYQPAIDMLTREYESLPQPNNSYGVRLLFCLTTVHLLHGELERSRQVAERLLRDAAAANLLLLQGWGYYLQGRVYQEWNQLEQAAACYQHVVDLRFTSNLISALEGVIGYIYVQYLRGLCDHALQMLATLDQFHGEQAGPLPAPVLSFIAWLKWLDGSREEALRWAESFDAPAAGQSMVWYHIPHLNKVNILLAQANPEADRLAARLLDEVLAVAESTHNRFTTIRVLLMQAVLLARGEQKPAALAALERALHLARPGRFLRAFLELGPQMQKLLQEFSLQPHIDAASRDYARSILRAASGGSGPLPALPPAAPRLDPLLTGRELEVLQLLAGRLSIREIAARMSISPSTVQQHTHHIYRKLNVNNKRQAVAAAVELGILPQPG